MMTGVRHIRWDDYTEAIPAFLTLIIMPVTFSITEGIAFGFISYALLKLVTAGTVKPIGCFTCWQFCFWSCSPFGLIWQGEIRGQGTRGKGQGGCQPCPLPATNP